MALGSLRCIDQCVIPVFMISWPFQLRFRPMNNHWNKNWIIFEMELSSTHSSSRIKIRWHWFYIPGCENRGPGHCKAASSLSMVARLKLPPLIRLILTPLDIYWFSVSKKVWNSKIQWSDQKLWLLEVCSALIGVSFRFHDISAVSTLISTHEQLLEWELYNLRNGIGFNPF